MCSLMEHSHRPEYKTEGDQVWQKVEGGWVNITPGVADPELVEKKESAEPVFEQAARDHGIVWPPVHTTVVQEFGTYDYSTYQPHGHKG